MYEKSELAIRLYAEKYQRTIVDRLGAGLDGLVYATTQATAVKGYRFGKLYQKERDVYLRLQDRQVTAAGPFKIPELVQFDDELEVLEIRIVSPPFLLDFTSAYLDSRPPFSFAELEAWHEDKEEQFGMARWSIVDEALSVLKRHGIWVSDVHPGNAKFENEPPE